MFFCQLLKNVTDTEIFLYRQSDTECIDDRQHGCKADTVAKTTRMQRRHFAYTPNYTESDKNCSYTQ